MELERENVLIEEVLKHYIDKLKDRVAEELSHNISLNWTDEYEIK